MPLTGSCPAVPIIPIFDILSSSVLIAKLFNSAHFPCRPTAPCHPFGLDFVNTLLHLEPMPNTAPASKAGVITAFISKVIANPASKPPVVFCNIQLASPPTTLGTVKPVSNTLKIALCFCEVNAIVSIINIRRVTILAGNRVAQSCIRPICKINGQGQFIVLPWPAYLCAAIALE